MLTTRRAVVFLHQVRGRGGGSGEVATALLHTERAGAHAQVIAEDGAEMLLRAEARTGGHG